MSRRQTSSGSHRSSKRLVKAKKAYRKLKEEIAPFVKRRRTREHSTDGQWCSGVECLIDRQT